MESKQLKPVDAVIVGFGWTGAIMAKELTDAGLNVVALERGDYQDTKNTAKYPNVADELKYSVRGDLFQKLKTETTTIRYKTSDTAVPYRQHGSFLLGNGVGGAGFHWNGMHWRALPEDIKIRSHFTEKYGKNFMPKGMTSQDYPMSYEELEPHFMFFEEVCGVSGKAGNINGKIDPSGNIFEGFRSKEYPNPPLANFYGADLFTKAAKNAGFHPFPRPASNMSQPYTNPYGVRLGPCNFCGFCENYGCYMYSKSSPQTTIIPVLEQQPKFELRVNSHVLKVELDSDGKKATGVTYMDAQGQQVFQPANMVLLCAFQTHNVRLLLLSKIGRPYDPATGEGVVGKNFAYQYNTGGTIVMKEGTSLNPFIGTGAGGFALDDFNGDKFDHSNVGFVGGAYISHTRTGGRPIKQANTLPGGPKWGKGWKASLREGYQRILPIACSGSVMSYEDAYLDLDPNYKDAFGMPLLRMTFNWHDNEVLQGQFMAKQIEKICREVDGAESFSVKPRPLGALWDTRVYQSTHLTGGAITGDNPKNSVVNKYLQCWDVSNVFVYGASAFPQNLAYNPTGVVGALTYFSAKAIREQYLPNPGPMVHA